MYLLGCIIEQMHRQSVDAPSWAVCEYDNEKETLSLGYGINI